MPVSAPPPKTDIRIRQEVKNALSDAIELTTFKKVNDKIVGAKWYMN